MSPTDARRMTRAGLTLSIGEVLGKLATLVMLGVLARALGVAEFGAFSYGLGLGLLLASIVTLGLDQRLVQLAGQRPRSLSARLSSLLAMRTVLTLVVVVITALVLSYTVDDPERRTLVIVLVVAACGESFIEAFRAAASVRHVQSGPALVLIVERFLALALVLLALHLGYRTTGVAVAYLAAVGVGVVLMAATARRAAGVQASPWRVSITHTRDFMSAVRVTGLNDLVSMALFRVDVVLLAWLAGTVAVGHYTAAYRLLETVLFISWSIARVLLPALADESPQAPDRGRTVSGGLIIVGAIYLPYAAVLLTRGDEVVRLLFGDEFGSMAIISWLALAPFFFGIAQVALSALLALRPDPAVLLASSLALVANVALDLLLIQRWGAVAAAGATTIAYAIQAGVLLVALRRRFPPTHIRRNLILSTGASVVAGAVMLSPVPLLVALVLGGLTYAVTWWVTTRRWDPSTYQLVRTVLPGAS